MIFMINVQNLIKTYGTGDTAVHALKNLSLEINDGEMTAVIGTSGSGKSTLLHALGGLDTDLTGKIFYDETNIMEMNDVKLSDFRLKNIGFVFQFFNLVPELTAKENILVPLMIGKVKADEKYFNELSGTLGIADRLSHYPSQLSGGQQQRVAIARALINKPKVILCDEPTGNLDKKSGDEVMQLLKKLRSEYGQTIIMVTHDSEIASTADRIIRIEDGEMRS